MMERSDDILKRVLVIDDDPETLELLSRILGRAGYEVFTTENAFDAYAELRTRTYPVLLCDIMMPGKSGQELIRDVLDLVKGNQVVLMTAHSSIEKVLDAYQEGASDYLLKPFSDANEVVQAVERAVARFQRWFSAIQRTYTISKEAV